MGPQRHILWNDAIHGFTSDWFGTNYYISENCTVVTNSLIWTVENLSFILVK